MSAAIKCDRCKRRYRGHGDWNTVFTQGFVTGHLCPACQTPEENAEAEINLATIDYDTARIDDLGRVWVKPKAAIS